MSQTDVTVTVMVFGQKKRFNKVSSSSTSHPTFEKAKAAFVAARERQVEGLVKKLERQRDLAERAKAWDENSIRHQPAMISKIEGEIKL